MAKSDKIDGTQKAAILLMAMGDDFARDVFKQLSDYEIELLGKRMALLEDVTIPVGTVRSIMNEFQEKTAELSGVTGKGLNFVKKVLVDAIGDEKAEPILSSISQATDTGAFSSLRHVNSAILVDYLRGEHPQTIALVLAHLDYEQVAMILKNLPEKLQPEIIYRMANLGMVPSGVVNDVDKVLKDEIESMGSMESKKLGGIESVAEIMNSLDNATETNIFSFLEEEDADLAEGIRQKMFVFEDIINVDNRGIQAILKEITNEDLILSLKTSSDTLKDKILSNMSSRASDMLRDDMEAMGPVKLSDVETSQQSIVRVVRKLESAGKIVIGGKGGGDVLI
ncbi:MAG: flagellar motor switch protein FliG [Thermodesulfobacteriota bacterium]|nr:flagellar motor switch protein FliG [Thermodesulfobacteriota bacterium]